MFKNVQTNLKPIQHKKNKNLPTKPFTSKKKRKEKIYVAVRLQLDILRSQNQSVSPRPICPSSHYGLFSLRF